jgi:hypothetical protein
VQLRALPVLWRDATSVQVGTDPRWAVVLTDLSPTAARTLAALGPGATARSVRAAFAADGVPAEAGPVLDHLGAARLLVDAPRAVAPSASADAKAWSLLAPDGDGAGMVTARQRLRVRVVGLGRLGAVLAAALANAGVGTLELEDDGAVGPDEVGFGGLTAADVGSPRPLAVGRAAQAARQDVRVLSTVGRRPDLVVLVDRGVADPVRYQPLLDADVPHLSVVLGEADVRVGPLVQPGSGACAGCVALHHADADPLWPALAAQLLADRTTRSRVEESSLAHLGGALAAAQALAFLDGRTPSTVDASLDVALPSAVPRARQWGPHRECRCGGHVGSSR